MRKLGLLALCSWLIAATNGYGAIDDETRIALVIGNGDYANTEPLVNPTRDAEAIAETLEQLGFEVDLQLDLGERPLELAMREFGLKAEQSDVALVYYAGHGLQVDGRNYLIPTDARLQRERDLLYEALPLDVVMSEVAQADRLGMVMLDACRDNPLADRLAKTMGVQSGRVGQGLARVEDTPTDTLVAFATRADAVAYDGTGDHSPFTQALLDHIPEPDLELSLVFRKVRDSVLASTNNLQEPFTYGSMSGEPFFFKKRPPNRSPELARPDTFEILDNAGATGLAMAPPTDADGDNLSIQIIDLPRTGRVLLDQEEVTIGRRVNTDEFAALMYEPVADVTGAAGRIAMLITDGRGGATTAVQPIMVLSSNEAPTFLAPAAATVVSNPLGLEPPIDNDGDDVTLTVTDVPNGVYLRAAGQSYVPGAVVPLDRVADLRLDVESGLEGELGVLGFLIEDDRGGQTTSEINVIAGAADTPPLVAAAEPAQTAEQEVAADVEETEPVDLAATEATVEDEDQPAVVASLEPATANDADSNTRAITPAVPAVTLEAMRVLVNANLRQGPSREANRVGFVREGSTVFLRGEPEGRWLPIRTEDGQEAYVFASLITPDPNAEPLVIEPAQPQLVEPIEEPETVIAAIDQDAVPSSVSPGSSLQDCPHCPELVQISAGRFTMGSESGDSTERPRRPVSIGRPFAIGRFEVTVREWLACVSGGGCNYRPKDGTSSPNSPIRNLSWTDAQDYVTWLSEETGENYRLPTEAEWEYAARGGTNSNYWWGDRFEEGRAICKDCGPGFDRKTPPDVGQSQANPYGLMDTSAGVAEWVADCWFHDYRGAPSDGSARTDRACTQYVLRGGSWRNDQSYLTSSSRLSYDATVRYFTNGLRVARDIN